MTQFAKETLPISLEDEMRRSYLDYAMSVIVGRALPDARDGLKPVHRRVLFAMHELNNDWNRPYKKSARIVGDVIGKYHPHGDSAVYDTIVRMAQDFSLRHMLVDGQGNFGSVDGDNAAAMRYTEIRLSKIAHELLDDLDKETVNFGPNYDGSEKEPLVMPAKFPNLLVNGSAGIAVGMATSIPPHNAAELCEAALHLINTPAATDEKLVQFVQGPDFPTGGTIIDDRASILEAYRTGRGSFRVRARWHKEELPRGGWQVVVTEIPYQVQKGRLVEKIAELLTERKLPHLGDVRDESAEDIRLVLEPKTRTMDATLFMEQLFRATELEARIPLNMNVLSMGKVPKVLSLKEALKEWLDHRKIVLVRRSQNRLGEIARRLEVLGGYLIAYLNLDEVIRIIREEDEPKPALIKRFKLTENQAEAILNMRLRSLRKLEEFEIRTENDKLTTEQAGLQRLLESESQQWESISEEIRLTRDKYGKKTSLGKRRTDFAAAPEVDSELEQSLVEREPVTIVCSEKGWIRAMKGHLEDASSLAYKDGDKGQYVFHAETTDKILLLGSSGKFFTLDAGKLPGGRGHGEPVRLMCDLENTDAIVALFVHKPDRKLILASSEGDGFIIAETECVANTRKGKQVLNVKLPAEAHSLSFLPEGADHLAVVGENRKLLIFKLSELPEMSRGKGVRLQKYKDGGLSDIRAFRLKEGLTWTDSSSRLFTITDLAEWIGDRAGAGRIVPKGFPRSNRFS